MFIVSMHIFYRAKQLKKQVPKNYKEILKKKTVFPQLGGNKIIFSFWKDGFTTSFNASAIINGYIIFSPEWAVRLVLFNDETTINAFTMTVGHELTHKGNEFYEKGLHGKDKKFQSWLNEVYADFGGAEKMIDCDRIKLINALKYIQMLKKKDKDTNSHPSWAKRKEYAEKYNFDEKLIRKIADDVKCENEDLIDKAICHYKKKKIILKP